MGTLVIKDWKAEAKPIDNKNNFINITGREGGLLSWLLALLRVDPTTNILIGVERVEFTGSSLAGTESRLIPLEGICSTYYGYHKPWKTAAVIIGIFSLLGVSLGGEIGPFVIMFAMGLGIGLLYYFLNRTLALGFVEVSGVVSGIRFKRSVIENLDVNQDQAKMVCLIVQRLIEAKHRRMAQLKSDVRELAPQSG